MARPLTALVLAALLLAGCAPAGSDSSDDGTGAPAPPGAGPSTAAPPDEGPSATGGDGSGDREEPGPAPPRDDGGAARADESPGDGAGEVDRSAVVERLERLLADARGELDDARLGLTVVAGDGEVLVEHAAEQPLLPASTLKLVTAAALLTTLGPEARLRTSVETTGPVDADGVVRGDLHLVGSGDPVLGTPEYGRWVYPARPRTRLEDLADQLEAAGVRRIAGSVVGSAQGFTGPRLAEGWPGNYLRDFDARHITGLTVDGGLVTQVTWPERPEADAEDGETGEGGGGAGDPDGAERPGAQASDEPPRPRLDDVEPERVVVEQSGDPAFQAAADLGRLLEERGIEIGGGVRSADPATPAVGTLARVRSPPLHVLLRFMVQRSDNHLADTLFHVAGRVRTGEGSWERGERALLQVLDYHGVPTAGVRLADGSGLSRDDRLTARSLVVLNRRMLASRHGETWASLMAVAGEGEGTLRRRLRDTPARGRLLAKTGSLRDVAALSGFVRGDDGRRHHFALLANDARGRDRAVARALADELALLLAADLQDCGVASAPGEDGVLGRPPLVATC